MDKKPSKVSYRAYELLLEENKRLKVHIANLEEKLNKTDCTESCHCSRCGMPPGYHAVEAVHSFTCNGLDHK